MNNIKFSIIVPVYNVKDYLKKCLDSILNQTYQNFELIIVDDGSNDGSELLCDKYKKIDARINVFHKKNGGLSDARNYGVKHITGDYLLFIDSDDYIENKLLEKLHKCILLAKVDIIRFGLNVVDENYKVKFSSNEKNYINETCIKLIDQLISTKFLEPACFYCYNADFFKNNHFKYEKGKLHEDYGLTPLILCKSSSMSWINYNAYNYLQRKGSIVNTNDEQKNMQKASDMLFHYDNFLSNCNFDKKIYKKMLCYLSESLICKSKYLNKNDYELYKKELKKRHVASKIYAYNYKKLLKKFIAIVSIELYIKIFCE